MLPTFVIFPLKISTSVFFRIPSFSLVHTVIFLINTGCSVGTLFLPNPDKGYVNSAKAGPLAFGFVDVLSFLAVNEAVCLADHVVHSPVLFCNCPLNSRLELLN